MSALNFVIILLCVVVSSLCIALKLLIEDFREIRIKVLKLETFIEADDFADEFVNGLKDLHIEADRKTEPSNAEKPNNCETCKHYLFTDIDGYYCEHETYGQPCDYEPKTEQTERSE